MLGFLYGWLDYESAAQIPYHCITCSFLHPLTISLSEHNTTFRSNAVGREAIEGLHFLASLPRAGARRKKTQPFNWIHSRLFT